MNTKASIKHMDEKKIINLTEFEERKYEEINISIDEAKEIEDFLIGKNLLNALSFGLDSLRATHFVGSIKYKDLQIDIYPKYLANSEADFEQQSVQKLIEMLAYTKQLEINIPEADAQKNRNNSFLEILIYFYAQSLFESLKRHNPHHYQQKEENLNTIRGRIDFANNIRYNSANKAKIFCRYEEFTTDNLLNQTLYFVSHLLYRKTQNEDTKELFKKIFAIYDDITLIPITYEQTKKIRLSKQQQKFFSTPFRIAQLFLEHSNINLYNSDLKNFAILFNMNKLFEEFIYEKLRNELEGEEIRVESQRSKCLIEGFEHSQLTIDKKKYVRTDILIKKEDRIECIIDTKYKDPKEISSSDIYQMLAYARIYKETKDLHLIYPQYQEQFDKCKAIFCDGIEENDLNLQISTIDLTQDIKKIEIKGLFYKK